MLYHIGLPLVRMWEERILTDVIVGLDIGTSSIRVAIGEIVEDNAVEIMGLADASIEIEKIIKNLSEQKLKDEKAMKSLLKECIENKADIKSMAKERYLDMLTNKIMELIKDVYL